MPKDQQYTITVTHGRIAVAEADGEATVLFTLVPADVEKLTSGELDLNAAFMQGRVKASGDMHGMLAVLKAAPRA